MDDTISFDWLSRRLKIKKSNQKIGNQQLTHLLRTGHRDHVEILPYFFPPRFGRRDFEKYLLELDF